MPPQGIIARLAGLLSPPEAEASKGARGGWLDQHPAAAAAVARRSTAPLEDEEEEEEDDVMVGCGSIGGAGVADENAPPLSLPLSLHGKPGAVARQASPSYFSDQDGRHVRGSSIATSLDVVAAPPPPPLASHKRGLSWMTDLGTGPLSLEEFVELLPSVLERCQTRHMRKCEPVKRLLERLSLPKASWERFAFWDADKLYTRNLVATDNKSFTLLLLCWNPGKESPIHDHPCEGCWVKSVQGTVKETVYQMDPARGQLVPEQENFFHPGQLSYIEDSLGFHKVGNPDPELGAVTLHCYIPPPRMARVWLASKGTRAEDSMTVPTCLYSAFGKRVTAAEAEAEGGSGSGNGTIMAPVPAPAPASSVPVAAMQPVPGGAGEVAGSPSLRPSFVGPSEQPPAKALA